MANKLKLNSSYFYFTLFHLNLFPSIYFLLFLLHLFSHAVFCTFHPNMPLHLFPFVPPKFILLFAVHSIPICPSIFPHISFTSILPSYFPQLSLQLFPSFPYTYISPTFPYIYLFIYLFF